MYDIYIPLLTYEHADGAAGSKVIPGLAESTAEDQQRRQDLHAVPAQGPQVLRRHAGQGLRLHRTRSNACFKLNSGGSPFYTDIVGAEKFAETKQGGIPGIKTNDKTGEIIDPPGQAARHLHQRAGADVRRAGPAGHPGRRPHRRTRRPATGPYVITKSQPGRGWEYERNPHWAKDQREADARHARAATSTRSRSTVIRNHSTQVNDIEQGKYDWMQNPPPADRYAEVKAKYEGTQFRVEPTISTYYFWMNTTEAAVRRRQGAPGGQLRGRPRGAGTDLRRPDRRHPADPAAGDARATRNSTSTRTTWPRRRN